MEFFGVSIYAAASETPLFGIIYLPVAGKLYTCIKGEGANLNGEKIMVSRTSTIKTAYITHNSNFRRQNRIMLENFAKITRSVFNIRMSGSCIMDLAGVAEGKADADIEYDVKPWDVSAGALLVEEAGGKVTGIGGNPWQNSRGEFVASNGLIHQQMLAILE